eukprot:6492457-Amphidinium_carterae.1
MGWREHVNIVGKNLCETIRLGIAFLAALLQFVLMRYSSLSGFRASAHHRTRYYQSLAEKAEKEFWPRSPSQRPLRKAVLGIIP